MLDGGMVDAGCWMQGRCQVSGVRWYEVELRRQEAGDRRWKTEWWMGDAGGWMLEKPGLTRIGPF